MKSGHAKGLSDIRKLLGEGWPVIVFYSDEPGSFHYSVAVAAPVYSSSVLLADPYSTKYVNWPEARFSKVWYTPSGDRGWWMAIKPREPKEKKEAKASMEYEEFNF